MDDARSFLKCCTEHNVPAYLERSRSGNVGHVWVFFEQPYPALKSRKIILSLLIKSGVVSTFDKKSSFDRLFPNQDTHSGKRLGNLIALPLYKPALDNGNSCFIDADTMVPFEDQWLCLSRIRKVTIEHLKELNKSIAASSQDW